MFSSLFKPKWQHRDPQVRKQAVAQLRADESTVLLQVAREDSDASVRQAAIRRIVDFDRLWELSQSDQDEATRELARSRFIRLLGGDEIGIEDVSARSNRLQAISDLKIIEQIARSAAERTMRLAAQQRVDRDALLGDIALQDPDAELRAQAAHRITQRSTLERVAKGARGKDKRVHAVVRDRLAELQQREELPNQLRNSARGVCAAMEALHDVSDLESIPARLAPIRTEWSQILEKWQLAEAGEFDAELRTRYESANAVAEERLAAHARVKDEEQARAAHHAELEERKREICERLEAQLTELGARTEPVDDDATLRQLLLTMNSAWGDLESLPADKEGPWSARFKRVASELAGYAEQSAHWRAEAGKLRELLQEAKQLAQTANATPKQIEAIERPLRDTPGDRHAALKAQIREVIQGLRSQHAEVAEKVRERRSKIESLMQSLEEHIAAGLTAAAHSAQRDVQNELDAMDSRELGALRSTALLARFNAASKQLREWSKWKRWAGAPVKEQLVQAAEDMAREVQETPAAELNHRDIAEQVRIAREQWKKLGATDNPEAKALWERFDAACTAAYAPCAARFEKEREQRSANAGRLDTLCASLEKFVADTDWENADWDGAERMLRDAQRKWERPGAIDRSRKKSLDSRFKTAIADLEQHLNKERNRNKFRKEALIKRARQLAASIAGAEIDGRAVNDAVTAARGLQDEWKRIGVSTDVQALWDQFRTEINAVFSRRKAVYDEQDQQRQSNLTGKEALCAELEEIARRTGEAASTARGRVSALKSEYASIGPVPRESEKKLHARFDRAVRDFEKQLAAHASEQHRAAAEALVRKSRICTTLEDELDQAAGSLALEPDAIAAAARTAEGAWQSEAPLAEAFETALSARLKGAISLADALSHQSRDAAIAELRKKQEEQRRVAEELCLRLEIATGAESPADQRDVRMQFQVERLARKLGGANERSGGGDEVAEIRREWLRVGPLSSSDRKKLEARFEKARAP